MMGCRSAPSQTAQVLGVSERVSAPPTHFLRQREHITQTGEHDRVIPQAFTHTCVTFHTCRMNLCFGATAVPEPSSDIALLRRCQMIFLTSD